MLFRRLVIAAIVLALYAPLLAGDWPQFRGPHRVGKGGSVIYADGMLYCYAEDGTLGLLKASPKSCEVVSKFKITQGAGEH